MWTQVKRNQSVPWQVMNESTLILNPKESKAHELNSSAGLIWKSIDSWTSLDYLVGLICDGFNVDPSTAKDDIIEVIEQLKQKNLVEWE